MYYSVTPSVHINSHKFMEKPGNFWTLQVLMVFDLHVENKTLIMKKKTASKSEKCFKQFLHKCTCLQWPENAVPKVTTLSRFHCIR